MKLKLEKYIGTKVLLATEMSRRDYNLHRGWPLYMPEDIDEEGFLVEYTDQGNSNHPDHEGYISWSPRAVFQNAYRRLDNMTFGQAVEALKQGDMVRRTGWNGKGMHIYLEEGRHLPINVGPEKGESREYAPVICMFTAQGVHQPGWLASQADILAEDWELVE